MMPIIGRVAIVVSKLDHCLADLLQRHRRGELRIDVPVIVSNHDTCAMWADLYKFPFEVFTVSKETKTQQEQQVLATLKHHRSRAGRDGTLHANSQWQFLSTRLDVR